MDTVQIPRELLQELRDNTGECLNEVLPNAGYARYDRRIAAYQDDILQCDLLLFVEPPEEYQCNYCGFTGSAPHSCQEKIKSLKYCLEHSASRQTPTPQPNSTKPE